MNLQKHKFPFLPFLFGLLFIVGSLSAQKITVKPITLLDKLPVKAIHRIFQDSDGYMWYGTFNGLCRYDGYDICVFRSDMFTPNLLRDNYITYIAEDHEKKIWFGTLKGLYTLDKATYQINPVEVDDISERNIFTINVTGDGTVWVSVAGSLYRFNADGILLKKYEMEFNQTAQCVYIVYEDKEGNLLISVTDSGMYKLNKETDMFEPYFHHKEYRFIERIIWDDIHHCYWLGTWEKGIVRFDPKAASTEQQYIPQPLPMDIAHQSTGDVFHMVQDNVFHYLWVTTDKDLFVFKITERGKLEQVDTSSFLPIGNKMLYEIYKDREGKLWVSAFDMESFIVDIRDNGINKYSLATLRDRIKANPAITSLCKDDKGIFWFTQERYGVCIYNSATDELKHYTDCPNAKMLSLENVTSLTASKIKGSVWGVLYPFSSLIVRLHQDNMEIRQETCINLHEAVQHPGHVLSLLEDKNQDLWIGTNKGLFVYRTGIRKLEVIDKEVGSVNGIVQANDGKIWFAVSNKGIGFIKSDGQCEIFPSTKDFICMDISSDGKLWLGTGLGEVLQFDTQKKTLSDHSAACGMTGDFINQIVVDIYNHIWIVTNQMLKEYNPNNGAYRSYATNNPQLLLNRFMQKSVYYDLKGGDIFFGGVSGIISISPSQDLESIPEQIVAHITDVRIMGKSIRKEISSENSIRLSPDNQDLEISFSSLNYHDLGQIRYAYRLVGMDNDWTFLNPGENKAFYNKLGKGMYTFQVKSTDKNGLWSDCITELEIYRLPAFYETWWAYLIYVCISLGLISLFVFLYIQRMRRKNNKKLAEKMTQLKLRYFTNVSHELLTPLTVLSCLAGSIHSSDEEDKKHVSMMLVNIKRLRNLLQQILDLRRIDNKKMRLSVSYGDVLAFLQELYKDSFSFMMNEKQIDFSFEVETDNVKGYFDRDKLDKIISNLLSNAYKYTPSGKSVTLSVNVKYVDDHEYLVLKVEDQGIGISSKEHDKIFIRFYNNKSSKPGLSNGIGLSLTKELVELHHGHITLESTLGKGSVFTVEIPLDKESYLPDELHEISEPILPETDELEPAKEGASQETLLLVEDNRELLYLMRDIFSEDYQVVVTENGKDAWEYIQRNSVDIVVSDIMMPEMDGMELCRHIKEDIATSHIIVILLTAQMNMENEIASYELGADGYVSKPFEPNVLKVRLRNLLKKRKQIQADFKSNPSAGMISKIDFTSLDEQLIEKAIKIVERNLSDPEFDVVVLAGELGMSRSTLARKIKGITGRTPLDFIKDIKMKHACRMLKNKSMSIAEVVVALGYNDHKYFAASFKEAWGMTPSEYQKKAEAEEIE